MKLGGWSIVSGTSGANINEIMATLMVFEARGCYFKIFAQMKRVESSCARNISTYQEGPYSINDMTTFGNTCENGLLMATS